MNDFENTDDFLFDDDFFEEKSKGKRKRKADGKKRAPRLWAWGQHASRGTEGRTSSPRRRRGLRGVGVIGL